MSLLICMPKINAFKLTTNYKIFPNSLYLHPGICNLISVSNCHQSLLSLMIFNSWRQWLRNVLMDSENISYERSFIWCIDLLKLWKVESKSHTKMTETVSSCYSSIWIWFNTEGSVFLQIKNKSNSGLELECMAVEIKITGGQQILEQG